jgi:hypothetical protein
MCLCQLVAALPKSYQWYEMSGRVRVDLDKVPEWAPARHRPPPDDKTRSRAFGFWRQRVGPVPPYRYRVT